MVDLVGAENKDGIGHKTIFTTLQVLDNMELKIQTTSGRWAAILHDIGKPATKKYEMDTTGLFTGMK